MAYTSISKPTATYSSIAKPATTYSSDVGLWVAYYSPWLSTSYPWLREVTTDPTYDDIDKPSNIVLATVNMLTGTINNLIGIVNDLDTNYQGDSYEDIDKITAPIYTDINKPNGT